MSSGNPLFAVLWAVLLFFIAWPVAGICAGLWLLLQPFEAVLPFLKQVTEFLEKLLTWPRTCGKAIADCSQSFPAPM
eukprot:CAMPEP_0181025822 /NCGR_PEP_ID=MMETSP1070-20121207/3305_1 /TAXON_ID=265543 /ORGANISM="Minutocellus polymorphus, Strain NH13" /LENGTH=76 /DNA_ID=CAMNT_0023102961 /DNA_START=36 /DNA_END=266 /DNA_ORIENTATION=+